MTKTQLVFWDWNGTLLDDLDYAIGVRNRVFPAFGLPKIANLDEYYAQFTFPVRLYYERAGVTDEQFDAVAHAWMAEYIRGMAAAPLRSDALSTLTTLRERGLRQVILSASSIPVLTEQLNHYALTPYFDTILGLSHIYATSKQAIGEAYLQECGIPPCACTLIGDSLHDADVARAMGTQCILLTGGHQSRDTLLTAGVPVCTSLTEAAALLG